MATFFYARVSTTEQNISHQASHAETAGFRFDQVVYDNGVSGIATKLRERPEGRRLFDLLRSGDTLVVRWVDRLGRDYADVCDTIHTFMRTGVIIRTIINGMTFDGSTKDPMERAVRDALIGFMAAMSEAQGEATKQAQRAGIAHAKTNGVYKGRKPTFTLNNVEDINKMKSNGESVASIARQLGLTRQTVYRVLKNAPHATSVATSWKRDKIKG